MNEGKAIMCVLVGMRERERDLQMWSEHRASEGAGGIAFQQSVSRWSLFLLTVTSASGATRFNYVPIHHRGLTFHSLTAHGEREPHDQAQLP